MHKEDKRCGSARRQTPGPAAVPSPPPPHGERLQPSSPAAQKSFVWPLLWEKRLGPAQPLVAPSQPSHPATPHSSPGRNAAGLQRILIFLFFFFTVSSYKLKIPLSGIIAEQKLSWSDACSRCSAGLTAAAWPQLLASPRRTLPAWQRPEPRQFRTSPALLTATEPLLPRLWGEI